MQVHSRIVSFSSSFPQEICDLIMDVSDEAELFVLTLVSRYWKPHAHSLLFERLSFIAGPRCVLWRKKKQVGVLSSKSKKIDDRFHDISLRVPTLNPTLRSHVKAITFRGLSKDERRRARSWSIGDGDDPTLTMCDVMEFVRQFPNVYTVVMDGLVWASCLDGLLDASHRCLRDAEKKVLQSVTVRRVIHRQTTDAVFDVLELARTCRDLCLDDVEWRVFTPDYMSFLRAKRPDVKRLELRIPYGFAGSEIGRHYPSFGNLVSLDISDVNGESRSGFRELFNQNAESLETLNIRLRDEGFSIMEWASLGFHRCVRLRDVHISFQICEHPPTDDCAGSHFLEIITAFLPPSLVHLSFEVTLPLRPVEARKLLRRVPDWRVVLANLKIGSLEVFELHMPEWTGNNHDESPDDGEHLEWSEAIRGDLEPIKVIYKTYDATRLV
ncbi:hypothetical protein EIP86_004718 [Pleurotus ostreatoroseus]|nr:hypothetical protein EIP86_004718 [Pleurotus ostreatoroseus]